MRVFGNRLRTPEFARRKQRMFFAKLALLVFLVGATIFGFAYLARLDSFQIRDVIVQGAEVVDTGEITAAIEKYLSGTYLFLFPKANIFLYPRGHLEATVLESFMRLKTAEVSFQNLHTIKLSVTERSPEALWCGENRLGGDATPACYFLDREGYIYTEAPVFIGSVYLRFYGPLAQGDPLGQVFLPAESFANLMKFLKVVAEKGFSPVELALLDTDVELFLGDGTKILFDRAHDLSRVLDNLLSALSAQEFKDRKNLNLEYIDLRFGNKVYYLPATDSKGGE